MAFDVVYLCTGIFGIISDFRMSESFFCQRDTNRTRRIKVSYLTGSKFPKQYYQQLLHVIDTPVLVRHSCASDKLWHSRRTY